MSKENLEGIELNYDLLLEVMNLGMTLRQDQLNGYTSISGNDRLNKFLERKRRSNMVIHHIDRNLHNNKTHNLRCVSAKENIRDN